MTDRVEDRLRALLQGRAATVEDTGDPLVGIETEYPVVARERGCVVLLLGEPRPRAHRHACGEPARDSGRSDEVNLSAGSNPKPVDALGCRSSEMEPIPFGRHGSGSKTRTC